MNKKTYVIYVDDQPIKVSKRIYKVYWQDREREKYLDKLHRRNVFIILDDVFDGADINTIEYELVKNQESPSDIAMREELLDIVLKAISSLSKRDRKIIQALYFDELTQTEFANKIGVSKQYISYKHEEIIQKLKKMIKI